MNFKSLEHATKCFPHYIIITNLHDDKVILAEFEMHELHVFVCNLTIMFSSMIWDGPDHLKLQ